MNTLRNILAGDNPGLVLRAMNQNGALVDLEPSIPALRMSIPAGYHHKDNFEHSIKVLENAVNRETNGVDIVLRTAALFHDIGKPATRKFGIKGLVTFENHEVVGARMVKTILRNHGYSKDEIKSVGSLVRLHMRSHNYDTASWTDAGVRRLLVDAGDLFERLVVLFYSDVTSGHASKREKVYRSVDMLVEKATIVQETDARKLLRPAVDGNRIMSLYGLVPGRELGQVMKFLNTDEGVRLTETEALKMVETKFNLIRKE